MKFYKAMKSVGVLVLIIFSIPSAAAQTKKYPALLWKVTGNGAKKPSYLYGTMHVSQKLAYHLSDQFFDAIKEVDVVGLESDPSKWVDEMEKYNLIQSMTMGNRNFGGFYGRFYHDAFKIQIPNNKGYSSMLSFDPELINSLLYRFSNSKENFEENTYIDLFIYQAGAKWNKKIVSLEDFKESMILGKLADMPDVDKDENDESNFYYGGYFSHEQLQDAYRIGDLDALDSISSASNKSKNYKKYLLEDRNLIFVRNIDSIIKSESSIFSGVGAAHLPGQKGVIELLRAKGYKVEPIMPKQSKKSDRMKDKLENTFKPVSFIKQYAADSLFSFSAPGKMVDLVKYTSSSFQFCADMTNGAFYNIFRVKTMAPLFNYDQAKMKAKIDSLLYEAIPGKMIEKKEIKNSSGWLGYDITNKTRRGDLQRYQIYISDIEIIVFKLGGKFEYINTSDAKNFFNSISFNTKPEIYTKYSPPTAGFEVLAPTQCFYEKTPYVQNIGISEQFLAYDKAKRIQFGVMHSIYHDDDYVEVDTFELNMLAKKTLLNYEIKEDIKLKLSTNQGFPSIDFSGKNSKNGQQFWGRIIIKGIHYYLAFALSNKENDYPSSFFESFNLIDFKFIYKKEKANDKQMYFTAMDEVSDLFENPIDDEANERYEQLLKNKKDKDPDYKFDSNYNTKTYYSYSSQEKVKITFEKFNDYETRLKENFWKDVKENALRNNTMILRNEQIMENKGLTIFSYILSDTGSTRAIMHKCFLKDGAYYEISVPYDTLIGLSGWTKEFFESFTPNDTVLGFDVFEQKHKKLFADLQSSDSTTRAKADISLTKTSFHNYMVDDLIQLCSSAAFDKISYESKAILLVNGGALHSEKIIEPYKQLYKKYTDSAYFQICILKGLAFLQTQNSYNTLHELIGKEPPLIGTQESVEDVFSVFYDSLNLCKSFFPSMLNLTKYEEYKTPVYDLMAKLVEDSILKSTVYSAQKNDLITEANYELKRYTSTNREENSRNESYDVDDYNDENYDSPELRNALNQVKYALGNSNNRDNQNLTNEIRPNLVNFVVVLAPFYNSEPSVKSFFGKLCKLKNDEVLLPTFLQLAKYGNFENDTIWNYFAKKPKLRIKLYHELELIKKINLFPKEFASQEKLCEAYILKKVGYKNRYGKDKIEEIALLKAVEVKNKRETGKLYIYKREDTKNKEERWACIFVEDTKKTLNPDIIAIDLNYILEKNSKKEEAYSELIEEFSTRFRPRVHSNQSYNYGYDDEY